MSLAHGGGAIFTSGRLLCTHAYVVTTRVDPRESHSLSWLLAQDVQDVDKLKEFLKKVAFIARKKIQQSKNILFVFQLKFVCLMLA